LGLERAVAPAQEHHGLVGVVEGDGKVRHAITVEIGGGHIAG